jgi:hypothetical protein
VRPGTRCECRDPECPANWDGKHDRTDDGTLDQCWDDATRLVTVRDDKYASPGDSFDVEIPLCEACAKHAEGGAK